MKKLTLTFIILFVLSLFSFSQKIISSYTEVCDDFDFTITAVNGSNYEWLDIDKNSIVTVIDSILPLSIANNEDSVKYYLKSEGNITDSITIYSKNIFTPSVEKDTLSLCLGVDFEIKINDITDADSVLWSNGETGNPYKIIAKQDTILKFTIKENGCYDINDSIWIVVDSVYEVFADFKYLPVPSNYGIVDETNFEFAETSSDNAKLFNWYYDIDNKPLNDLLGDILKENFKDSTFSYSFSKAGKKENDYYMQINMVAISTDSVYCKDTASYKIIVFPKSEFIEMPNVFTPNGDNVNDIFTILESESFAKEIDSYKIQIFDRWGKKVYESEDPEKGWDGTIKNSNRKASNGVYFYIITSIIGVDKKEYKNQKGFVHLIRNKD